MLGVGWRTCVHLLVLAHLLWCTLGVVCALWDWDCGADGPMYEDMGSNPLLERPVQFHQKKRSDDEKE